MKYSMTSIISKQDVIIILQSLHHNAGIQSSTNDTRGEQNQTKQQQKILTKSKPPPRLKVLWCDVRPKAAEPNFHRCKTAKKIYR